MALPGREPCERGQPDAVLRGTNWVFEIDPNKKGPVGGEAAPDRNVADGGGPQ